MLPDSTMPRFDPRKPSGCSSYAPSDEPRKGAWSAHSAATSPHTLDEDSRSAIVAQIDAPTNETGDGCTLPVVDPGQCFRCEARRLLQDPDPRGAFTKGGIYDHAR